MRIIIQFLIMFWLVCGCGWSGDAGGGSSAVLTEKTGFQAWLPGAIADAERLYGRGETFSAQLAYQTALAELLAGDKLVSEEKSAVAEFLLIKLLELGKNTGGNTELVKTFTAAASAPGGRFFFRWLANHALAEAALRTGRKATAEAASARLGILRDYLIIGPFANERGHAFGEDLLAFPVNKNAAEAGENALPAMGAEYRGKKKNIRWRFFHNPDPRGILDFRALCQPDTETLAYAAVFVECPKKISAALRTGADDTLAVWVNGKEIFRKDAERQFAFAQDNTPCLLEKGVNIILFKVGQAREQWQLNAALTAPSGQLLEGIREVTEEVWTGQKKCEEMPQAASADFSVDAWSIPFLREYTRKNPFDAWARYCLTTIQAHLDMSARQTQVWRKQMAQATRLDETSTAFSLALAELADERGRFKADRDDNLRRLALLKTLERDSENVTALTALAEYYLEEQESPRRAQEYAEKAVKANHFAAQANVVLAKIYQAHDWRARALGLLTNVAQRHPRHPGVRRALADCYLENGRADAALGALREVIAVNRLDMKTLRIMASLLRDSGRSREAVALWRDYLRLSPCDLSARREMADSWLVALNNNPAAPDGESSELQKFLEETLNSAPDAVDFHVLLGRLLCLRGKESEADKVLKNALVLDPARTSVRDYLRQRGNEIPEILPPISDLAEYVARWDAQPSRKVENGGRLIYLSEKIDELNGDGTKRRGMRMVYRVLSQSGVERGRRAAVWYDPEIEDVQFTAARVLHGDGEIIEAQIVPVQRPGTRQVRMAVFPALTKGDVVEIAYVVSQSRPDFFGDYFGNIQRFRSRDPIMLARYVLRAPQGKKLYFHLSGGAPAVNAKMSPGGVEWTWEMRNLAPLPDEKFAPPSAELSPTVQVSTFRDWNALACWYWGLIKSQNVVTPEITAKVAEITAHCEAEREKIAAIYDWVATEVRNNAWSFGVHGFKPYNAGTIFTRRFGDCKDKTTLINVMARVAGLNAWPVLVHATGHDSGRGIEDLALPVLAHFNHCISMVEIDGQKQFIDGTMRYRTLDGLPYTVAGAQAVVVRPEGAELASTPPYRAEDNLWKENVTLGLDNEGDADLTLLANAQGQASVCLRAWFQNEQTWDQVLKTVGSEKYGHVSAAVVNDAQINPLVDELKPDETRLDARLRLRGYVKRNGSEISCRLPAVLLSGTFGYDAAVPARLTDFAVFSHRETPLILPALFKVERSLRIEFPNDWELLNSLPGCRLEHPFGTLVADFVQKDGFVEIKYVLALSRTRIAPQEYPLFRRFCLAVDRLTELDLQFRQVKASLRKP